MMKTKSPTQGVIYCAVDKWSYLEAAIISAFTLRQLSPQLPIIILTNINEIGIQEELSNFNIDIKTIVIPEEKTSTNAMMSRLIKTSLHKFTEFDETLYLDADIVPLQPIDEIWSLLEYGNIAMAVDMRSTVSECDHIDEQEKKYTLEICPADDVQLNTGVILWRNTPDIHTLFENWQKEWNIFKQHDQLAFTRAVQQTKTKILHLDQNYNYPIYWLEQIYQNEKPEDIERWKSYEASELPPELKDIKLVHCFKSALDDYGMFKEVIDMFLPYPSETIWEHLRSFA